jgi:glycosyltransferase involved in cell wall biosynthesis
MVPELKLSVVIITFNEERNILRCIESVTPIADEILVVDSVSTDATADICKSKGVRFVQTAWKGYSQTKNEANGMVSHEYVLSIDADEALSPELIRSIAEEKSRGFHGAAYQINRLTNYCGKWIKHGGWYPDWKVRLFPREGSEWTGTIHEELILSRSSGIKSLSGHLYHYSYSSVEDHVTKSLKYSALVASQDFSAGKSRALLLHGILKPWFVFFRQYFLKLGFLDGYYGFVIAVISAFEKFMRYVQFRKLRG